MKPLSFENLFPPLRYSRLNSFKERRLPLFPAIMTLVYARALLSIEVIGRVRCHDGNSNVRKRHKSNRFRLAYQQLSTARAPRFFVHCFAVNARLRRELPNFYVSSTSWTYDDKFLFLSLNLNFFLKNSTPGKFAHIGQSERVGIIALKFQRTQSHFLSEVFAAVAVVVSLTP